MKFGELQSSDTKRLEEICRDNLTILWVNDYYDGPISGMANFRGARYLFEMIDRGLIGGEEEHRDYWLIALDEHQLQEEKEWHELFCQNVGTHFDYTGRSSLPPRQVDMEAFYEPYKKRVPPNYKDNDVVGWFRL